ncbi:MAG TPA: M56 family metallopeptidase, partial [Acidobacteriota bacterium]
MTASMWLHNLAWYSLQIALLVSAGALLALLFRLRAPTAILAYWQILLAACVLLPVCQPWKESVIAARFEPATQIIDLATLNQPASGLAQPTTRSNSWPISEAVLLLIGAGVVVRCAWLAAGVCSLQRFLRESSLLFAADKIRAAAVSEQTLQSRDAGSACLGARLGNSSVLPLLERAQQRLGIQARFYTSENTAMPITFGLLRPVILLPQNVLELEPHTQEAIIYHELLHVRRRDWIYSILEEFIRAILWFHPAIWWLIGRIHLEREQVVDQAVIQLTQSREQYVEALLAFVRAKTLPKLTPATLFLRKSLLKKRVAGIFKETSMSKRRLISCLVISF